MAAHPALATLALASHVSFFNLVSKLSPISFLGTDGHSDEHHGFSLHLSSFTTVSPDCRLRPKKEAEPGGTRFIHSTKFIEYRLYMPGVVPDFQDRAEEKC